MHLYFRNANVVFSVEFFNFNFDIKRIIKIIAKFIAILILLFIILVLLLSIPAIQTRLGTYATDWLNDDYNTNININRVGLQFNGDVELKEVLIKDYRNDTLISASEINTSILNFRNIINTKLAFGDIEVENLVFNLKTYKDEKETNLDVFVARFDEDEPKKTPSNFLLSSSDVSIYNGIFRLIDENKETPLVLEFKNIDANATNLLIKGSDVSTRINTLNFTDSRGLSVHNLSSNFKYTLTQFSFEDLEIKTKRSKLNGRLQFDYKREELADFENKVKISGKITDANLALDDLNVFYNEFGKNQKARFSTELKGTLNNLTTKNLRLTTSRNTKIYGTLNFKNLFESTPDNFQMTGDFKNLSSNYKDLKALLPNVLGQTIPVLFDKLGDFQIHGNTAITSKNIEAQFDITTKLGYITSDLKILNVSDINKASYNGNVVFDEFDLGILLEDPNLGKISSNLDIDGVSFDKDEIQSKLTGEVYTIAYNGYTYQDLKVNGEYQKNIFNGKLVANDANAKLEFDGLVDLSQEIRALDFVADVDLLNLKALHFYERDDIAVFKGKVDMKMKASSIDDAVGSINFKKTNYKNENGDYYFDDFAVTSIFKDDKRIIEVNSPDIVKGTISGNFKINDIPSLFENSIKSTYKNTLEKPIEGEQYLDFNFKIYNKIVEVFFPDLKLGKNTFVKGRVETEEEEFKLTFKSPKIEFLDYLAQEIEVQVDNKNPLFNTYVEVDSLSTKYYNASKFSLINTVINDTLFVRSEFKGGTNNSDDFNLSFYHTVNEKNKSVVGFKKSDVFFKDNAWTLNEKENKFNKIEFDTDFKGIDIDQVVLSNLNQEIALSGVLRDSTYKNITLDFKDVDLSKITPRVDSVFFAGNVNGKLKVLQENGYYLPESKITIDDLGINETVLGSFDAEIKGNQSLTNYSVIANIKNDDSKSLTIGGNVDVSSTKPTIDLDLNFDKFNIAILNSFLEPVLDKIRGDVYGQVKVLGDLNKPDFKGELSLKEGGLAIPLLKVNYKFDNATKVSLNKQDFIFNNVKFTDVKYNSDATLNGSLSHVNFSKWKLDLDLDTENLLVLNTKYTDEALYYGTGFIGGTAKIIGPTEALEIDVFGETKPNTQFFIPLNDLESFGDNSFIHFLTPEEKQAKKDGVEVIKTEDSGVQLNFDLDITSDAEIEIVMDRDSGSKIKGRGAGNLLFNINTNDVFKMYGDFVVWEGVYNFRFGGLIQKDFIVDPYESVIRWDGEPLKAQIDIKAIYSSRTNPSPLLDQSISQNIPVDLTINLSGDLESPEPDFEFEFPNVSSSIKSELDYRLNSNEEKEKQALNLLATGSFNRDLKDININGTIAERLNGLINGFFSSGDGKFNVGLNLEAGQTTTDFKSDNKLGVTLQTKITDRILINGKVGVPVGGVSESVVAGDVQVDFLLNKEGTLTAKVFNRENSIRNFGEEIGYMQGIGVSYSVDFDTFGELLRKIFKGNKNEDKKTTSSEEVPVEEENPLPDGQGFKKK